jgi:DNA-binding NtrC family response regulator
MQSHEPQKTVIFAGARRPEPAIEQAMAARAVRVQWAKSIDATARLLDTAMERTVVITELALADGNWSDLAERIRRLERPVSIILLTSASTAELWWDALECGVEDILMAPVSASRLCKFLEIEEI